eukprot:TRINITY_DN27_c0_g1_i16.p2 TRINITY_DN27_c0_g1~~TRINITY_DN27_c0_g1_i16.p2  ORF type:complete len:328 (+),score=120.90 TRINITY_DN27_c0_g1_i16:2276-3259(+)
MNYAGMKSANSRRDVIAFLKQNSRMESKQRGLRSIVHDDEDGTENVGVIKRTRDISAMFEYHLDNEEDDEEEQKAFESLLNNSNVEKAKEYVSEIHEGEEDELGGMDPKASDGFAGNRVYEKEVDEEGNFVVFEDPEGITDTMPYFETLSYAVDMKTPCSEFAELYHDVYSKSEKSKHELPVPEELRHTRRVLSMHERVNRMSRQENENRESNNRAFRHTVAKAKQAEIHIERLDIELRLSARRKKYFENCLQQLKKASKNQQRFDLRRSDLNSHIKRKDANFKRNNSIFQKLKSEEDTFVINVLEAKIFVLSSVLDTVLGGDETNE